MTHFATAMPDVTNDKENSSTPTADNAGSTASASTAAEGAPADAGAAELEKLRTERDELYNRYLRAVADLDNFRRRAQREKDELRQFAILDLVENLLPVYEHLGLAVSSAKQATDPEVVVTGVSMVLEQFRTTLGSAGLVEINPAPGAEFDPHQHESIAHSPSATIPAEKILQVVRTGFSIRGRLIRPASVVLSGGPAPTAETPAPAPAGAG